MIRIQQKGSFSNLEKYLSTITKGQKMTELESLCRDAVHQLNIDTPKDTGETAYSWGYRIIRESGKIRIEFHNTNLENGLNIALLLFYGHATVNGGWVEGIDYINPTIQPLFDRIEELAKKEVM